MSIDSAIIAGRTRKASWVSPWYWMLLNDDDRTAPDTIDGVPYLPGRPAWWRNLMWWCRNPAANFFEYVVGFKDRNYLYIGDTPLEDGTLADSGRTGWKKAGLILLDDHGMATSGFAWPYWSYAGRWVFYFGWRYSGGFGMKLHPNGSYKGG